MADLQRSSGRRPSRREREQRAYALTRATGGLAAVTVVTGLLAVLGVIGFGLPLVALVLAVVCGVLLRRTIGG